jgi:hypothetical protein
MKLKPIITAPILSIILIFCTVLNVAYAAWSAISSGYAVTTDWHGEIVPIGESVTAWAGTTNSEVYQVEFLWKNETEQVVFAENVTDLVNFTTPQVPSGVPDEIKEWAEDNPGYEIWYANNTQIPNAIGNWTVQAFFYASGGNLKGKDSDIIKIRATSLQTIPSIPILGTAGALLTMLLGLTILLKRRKK